MRKDLGSLDGPAASLMKSLAGGANGGASAKNRLDAVVAKVKEQSGTHRATSEMILDPPVVTPAPLISD
jgi:hypothetical protein